MSTGRSADLDPQRSARHRQHQPNLLHEQPARRFEHVAVRRELAGMRRCKIAPLLSTLRRGFVVDQDPPGGGAENEIGTSLHLLAFDSTACHRELDDRYRIRPAAGQPGTDRTQLAVKRRSLDVSGGLHPAKDGFDLLQLQRLPLRREIGRDAGVDRVAKPRSIFGGRGVDALADRHGLKNSCGGALHRGRAYSERRSLLRLVDVIEPSDAVPSDGLLMLTGFTDKVPAGKRHRLAH